MLILLKAGHKAIHRPYYLFNPSKYNVYSYVLDHLYNGHPTMHLPNTFSGRNMMLASTTPPVDRLTAIKLNAFASHHRDNIWDHGRCLPSRLLTSTSQ